MNAEILDRVRSTKIVATLGNVSSSPEVLTSLTAAGVNVFRRESLVEAGAPGTAPARFRDPSNPLVSYSLSY